MRAGTRGVQAQPRDAPGVDRARPSSEGGSRDLPGALAHGLLREGPRVGPRLPRDRRAPRADRQRVARYRRVRRLHRAGSGRAAPHRAGLLVEGSPPERTSQGVPADVRHLRRWPLFRPRRALRGVRERRRSGRDRDLRGPLARVRAVHVRGERRDDPVLAGIEPRPRRRRGRRPGYRGVVPAHGPVLRAVPHPLRRLRQPRRA